MEKVQVFKQLEVLQLFGESSRISLSGKRYPGSSTVMQGNSTRFYAETTTVDLCSTSCSEMTSAGGRCVQGEKPFSMKKSLTKLSYPRGLSEQCLHMGPQDTSSGKQRDGYTGNSSLLKQNTPRPTCRLL